MELFNKASVLILVFTLFACSKDTKVSSSESELKIDYSNLELEDYSKNALKILQHHKEKELQVALPNIILDQVHEFDKMLIEYEKKQTYATSDMEFLHYKAEIDKNLLDSLMMKDIQINLLYNDMLSGLEELNIEYSKKYNISIDEFDSFFDVDNILLSDEVLIKIKELAADEKTRLKIESNKNNESLVVDGLSFIASAIPFGSAISSTAIRSINTGIKLAKRGKDLPTQVNKITSMTYNVMKSNNSLLNVTDKIASKKINNELKRQVFAEVQLKKTKKIAAENSLKGVAALASVAPIKYQKSREYFKNIENKIEGRIGDFSDGILAVHLQNVREVVKKNQSKLAGGPSSTKILN